MAFFRSWFGAPGPLLANSQSPFVPPGYLDHTYGHTSIGFLSISFLLAGLAWCSAVIAHWTRSHKCSLSVSPDIAILMHQPWCPMVLPQLLHLDFCLLTGPWRREPLTHEKSWQWSLMTRWDRLCWSGAGCGQTSVWTKWQFIDAFYLIFPLISCTFSHPDHHGWIPGAWTVR